MGQKYEGTRNDTELKAKSSNSVHNTHNKTAVKDDKADPTIGMSPGKGPIKVEFRKEAISSKAAPSKKGKNSAKKQGIKSPPKKETKKVSLNLLGA